MSVREKTKSSYKIIECMERRPKPTIVVSKCLGFEACRYDGSIIKSRGVEKLRKQSTLIPVCPEVSIGLGIPRKPITLYKIGEDVRVIQNVTGRDLTEDLKNFSQLFIESIDNISGYVLKSKSPSCGFASTKIYTKDSCEWGSGVFAHIVKKNYPSTIIVDEKEIDYEKVYNQFMERVRNISACIQGKV